ncbi:MAG TPA: glycosyltransferase 87 family protein [Candidatus Limnocylindria bacterium]
MSPRRFARLVAMAIIIGIGIFNLYQAAIGWTMADGSAYWNAALRVREGAALYPPVTNYEASDVFRYSPWFAWAAVPFTYLPMGVAGAIWSAILLVASGMALLPLIRERAWLLVWLFGPILVGISANGNVHALLIALLVHGVERRSGPVWIAIAASLKIFPVLLALTYAGRREWGRFALAILLATVLWLPALAYDLSNYPRDPGRVGALFEFPVIYYAVVALAVGATLALAQTRYAWLSASTAVVLALPRLFVYDVTTLMVGADYALRKLPSRAPRADIPPSGTRGRRWPLAAGQRT